MAKTQETGSRAYLFSIVLVAIIGGLLFGYDTAVVSGAEHLQGSANHIVGMVHQNALHAPLHGGMDQRVDLVPAAVAGGQDHVGMSRQIVQHLQHLGLQAAVLLQVHDGLFRHDHALAGGEGHALAGVHDLVPQGGEEYSKRLSRYVTLNIAEVPDEKAPENMSPAQMEQVKNIEGQRLMKVFKDSYVVALAINGKSLTSEGLADFITQTTLKGVSHITFVIGGSLGLSDEVLNRADYKLSFSAMTFPHQLMRVILLEQIYRANRIIKNEPYHK